MWQKSYQKKFKDGNRIGSYNKSLETVDGEEYVWRLKKPITLSNKLYDLRTCSLCLQGA